MKNRMFKQPAAASSRLNQFAEKVVSKNQCAHIKGGGYPWIDGTPKP